MIDTDKYEGHTQGPWAFKGTQGLDLENRTHAVVTLYDDPRMRTGGKADMQLIADAPLILQAYKQLREQMQLLHSTWFADEEDMMASDVDERITTLLKEMIK